MNVLQILYLLALNHMYILIHLRMHKQLNKKVYMCRQSTTYIYMHTYTMYVPFAVISIMSTHTEIVEQQSIGSLRTSTGCAGPLFSLTRYNGLVKLKVIPIK